MKKIRQAYSKNYPTLKLIKSDLNELVNTLSQEFTEFKVRINEYEYSEIEIQEIFEKNFDNLIINVFEITGHCGSNNSDLYVSLSFDNDKVRLYLDDRDNIKVACIVEEIDKIVKDRVFIKSGIEYSEHKYRPIISLYKNEIVEIIQTIIANCHNYKIKIDEHEYSEQDQNILQTIENFFEKTNKKRIENLNIRGSVQPELSKNDLLFNYQNDTISLRLSNVSKDFEFSNDNNMHLLGIQDIIEKNLVKQKTFLHIFSSHMFYGIILAFSIILSYVLLGINMITINKQIPIIALISLVLGFIKFSDIFYIKNTISMRFENPPSTIMDYYQQNQPKIIFAVIIAILSAFVTWIFTKIFG